METLVSARLPAARPSARFPRPGSLGPTLGPTLRGGAFDTLELGRGDGGPLEHQDFVLENQDLVLNHQGLVWW